MSNDTLDTIWVLYHTGVISHIKQESDLDNLANVNKLFDSIVKAEKVRRALRIFTASQSDLKIRVEYFDIEHKLSAHNINSISVMRILFENPEYTILRLVNSDDTSQIIDNMSTINTHNRGFSQHLYEITIPKEQDIVYKLDKIRIHHSPCNVLSVVIAYGASYLKLYGKIISISPTITDVIFSETSYSVPSACLKWHTWNIYIGTDIEISECNVRINTLKEEGVDNEIYTYNVPKTYYSILNNMMLWHQFRSGIVGMCSIGWRPLGGDTICKTIEAPDPTIRFTPQEMLDWLKIHQIVQFDHSG
jgi:hypothetical protein